MASLVGNARTAGMGILGALIVTAFLVLGWLLSEDVPQRIATTGGILFGIALGWLFGVFLSPYDERDQLAFTRAGKAVTAFLSGYALAKVDRLVDAMLAPALVTQLVPGFRALAFGSSFIVALILTYLFRMDALAEAIRTAGPPLDGPSGAEH